MTLAQAIYRVMARQADIFRCALRFSRRGEERRRTRRGDARRCRDGLKHYRTIGISLPLDAYDACRYFGEDAFLH